MRRSAMLLLVGLLLLPAAGCATTEAVVEPAADTVPVLPPAAHPREFLAAPRPAAATLTGNLKLKITADDQRFTALGALSLAAPDTIQLEVNGPLGLTMLILRVTADTVVLIDYPHQSYLVAPRRELPSQYRGWVDLWKIFPQLDSAVVNDADWSRAGDTWTGIWGDPAGQNYRLTASVALGLTTVDFCRAAESVGTMALGENDTATRLPRRFRVESPGLTVEGELLNSRRNEPVRFAPLRIPENFRPVRLVPTTANE